MSDEKNKVPERDWVKEPYNTRDTMAAMYVPPLAADKGDTGAIEKRLARIEALLETLVSSPDRHNPEALATALNEVAKRYGYQPTGWNVQFYGTLQMGGFYKEK